MADLIKKNGNVPVEFDPFRAMREMLRWDPFREMAPMLSSNDRGVYVPTFDVTENKDSYVFKADVPGVKKEDLEITLTGNRLQISGKRDVETEEKKDTYYTYERQFGTFTRSFTLPEGIDTMHAKSELKEGVLTLVIPKTAAAQAKKIPISAPGAKS
jgi:HSP20 family protein